MKILITGATGFIGRNLLLEILRQKKYETIYLPVRNEAKFRAQLLEDGILQTPSEIRLLLMEAPKWDFASTSDIDHVVHCAGGLSENSLADYIKTNADATLQLLRTIGQPKKIIILSSQAAAGPCGDAQAYKTEEDRESPVTWYGISKLDMEKKVLREFSDMGFIFLRPPMVLGPRDSATLPLFKMAARRLQFKPGFQKKYYSFISAQDLVRAILIALESSADFAELKQKKYFVAARTPITDSELIETAGQVLSNPSRLLRIPQPVIWAVAQIVGSIPALSKAIPNLSRGRVAEIWPNRWVASTERFEKTFNWQANDDLHAALKEACDWYVKSGQLNRSSKER